MFTPAENMHIDENALYEIAKYLNVPVHSIQELMVWNHFFGPHSELMFLQDGFVYANATAERVAWFELSCFKDENALDGFSKKLDIVRYKVDEDVRDIPLD